MKETVIKSNQKSAIRLNITLSEDHVKAFKKSLDFQRAVSEKVFSMLKSKWILDIQSHALTISEKVELTNGNEIVRDKSGQFWKLGDRQIKYVSEFQEIIEKFFGPDYQKAHVDALLWEVARRYTSYSGRNDGKLPKGSIKIKDKGITYKSNIFRLDTVNKEILIKKMEKDKDDPDLKVPFEVEEWYESKIPLLGFGKKQLTITEPRGGILSLKKNEIVLMATHVVDYKKAKKWVGIDINKKNKNWIFFSEKVDRKNGHEKPDEIVEVEKYIRDIQKRITKDKSIRTKQRKGLRKKWKKAHAKHSGMVKRFIYDKLEKLNKKYPSMGMGIDTVGTGQKNGTFGQEKIIEAAQSFCKENSLPHYFVPTPFTSQRCNKCGKVSKLARCKITNIYRCTCGNTLHADLVASKNVAEFAKCLQDADFSMTGTLNKEYKVKSWEVLNEKFQLKPKNK